MKPTERKKILKSIRNSEDTHALFLLKKIYNKRFSDGQINRSNFEWSLRNE